MSDQRRRSYAILALIEAIGSGLIAAAIFTIYAVRPSMLADTGVSLAAGTLGVAGVIYYLTFHHVLARARLALSTLFLTIIITVNCLFVIASTGKLDSPFYSLWLLAIVLTGIFGTAETISALGVTLAYYVFALIEQGLHAHYIRDHLVQLAITLAAGGLAAWIHARTRHATAATSRLDALNGQLTNEQLKADAIVSSIAEGVMVVDSSRRIQLFNKAAQELTGWDDTSATGIDYRTVLQLTTQDDKKLDDSSDPVIAVWNKQEPQVRDNLSMTTRGGRKIQLSISLTPIYDSDKNPSGAIALFRDISKEKEVERQKDEFVSTASHEMRTPVAAIEGYISLAMNPNVATIDDRAKKYLDKAHETIRHLGELFRDLLSVTKAEEGQLNAKTEPVNLGELVQGAVDDMQFTVQKKNISLVYQIGGQSGKAISPLFYVAANPERLREVVMNLMENATKFTMEGGIKVTLEGDAKNVTVGVSDTGIGIAQEDMPHLFQKFYRIDNSATRTIGGTGLGLYLCRQVIELFNGRIWVESKQGEGSTFKFTLPRMSQDAVDRILATAPPAPSTPAPAAAAAPAPTVPAGPAPAPAPTLSSEPIISGGSPVTPPAVVLTPAVNKLTPPVEQTPPIH